MHSRIFEVVEVKDNTIYKSVTCADEIYEWGEYNQFYDYIVDMNTDDVVDSIRWIKDIYPNIFIEDNIVITNDNAKQHFKPKYEKLIETVNNLSLAEFSTWDNHFKLYDIKNALDDNYEFHIVVQDSEKEYLIGLYSLDDFIRNYRGEFKIVNAFDYHF